MEQFEVTILGCGSALPTSRHNGTSQIVNIRGKFFMIDCAEGTQLNLRKSHVNITRINTILLSHLHGDHCLGLAGYVSTLGLLGRTAPLHIYGPKDIESVFKPMISYFSPHLEFEVVYHELDTSQNTLIYEDRSLTIHTIPLTHRVPCCGYLFKEKPGLPHIRVDALERYGIPYSQINNIKNGMDFTTSDGKTISNEELTTPPDAPRSYAFCSDTSFKPDIIPIIRESTLLYHEATYGEDKKDLAQKYAHSTAKEAGIIAREANVGKLVIGHYSQRYEDETVLLRESLKEFPNTELANEGKTFFVGQ